MSSKSKFISFKKATRLAKSFNLKNRAEWVNLAKSKLIKYNLPRNPRSVYKDQWVGWGHFLGNGNLKTGDKAKLFWSFKKSKAFVRKQQLKNKTEFIKWRKVYNKVDLPLAPFVAYKDRGWVSWIDFLGTDNFSPYIRAKRFWPYSKARKLVRSLKLGSRSEFTSWTKNNLKISKCNVKLPVFPLSKIPISPMRFYKDNGWIDFRDFLGTNNKAFYQKETRSFKDAVLWVRETNRVKELIKTRMDYRDYVLASSKNKTSKTIKIGKYKGLRVKPSNIPTNPERVYREQWRDWSYFLLWVQPKLEPIQYLSYKKAKSFVHRLKLTSQVEWRDYCKESDKHTKANPKSRVIPSGKFKGKQVRPINIPRAVYFYYKGKQGVEFSFGDFLGTGHVQNHTKQYRSFKEARKFARSLGLRNQREWKAYCKSGKKPKDIPAGVDRTYKKEFKGYGNFLGTGNVHFSKVKKG